MMISNRSPVSGETPPAIAFAALAVTLDHFENSLRLRKIIAWIA